MPDYWRQLFEVERRKNVELLGQVARLRAELDVRTLEARLFNDALYADAREIQLLKRRA